MKKMKFICLLLAVLLIVGSLAACGGNKDDGEKTTAAASDSADVTKEEAPAAAAHDGWYYADIPAGFTATDEEEKEFEGPDGKSIKVYCVYSSDEKPDAAAAAKAKADESDFYTAGDEIKIGAYTFYAVNFDWNGAASQILYADLTDGYYAEITLYCMSADDADTKAFLESFKQVDGNPGDNKEAFLEELYN